MATDSITTYARPRPRSRRLAWSAVVLLAVAALTACGGGAPTDGGSQQPVANGDAFEGLDQVEEAEDINEVEQDTPSTQSGAFPATCDDLRPWFGTHLDATILPPSASSSDQEVTLTAGAAVIDCTWESTTEGGELYLGGVVLWTPVDGYAQDDPLTTIGNAEIIDFLDGNASINRTKVEDAGNLTVRVRTSHGEQVVHTTYYCQAENCGDPADLTVEEILSTFEQIIAAAKAQGGP